MIYVVFMFFMVFISLLKCVFLYLIIIKIVIIINENNCNNKIIIIYKKYYYDVRKRMKLSFKNMLR